MSNAVVNFSNLDLIPKLMEEMHSLKDKVSNLEQYHKITYDLSKRKGVREFLNISDATLNNYMKDGRFKENIHFTKEIKGKKIKITFVEDGILAFKKQKDLK